METDLRRQAEERIKQEREKRKASGPATLNSHLTNLIGSLQTRNDVTPEERTQRLQAMVKEAHFRLESIMFQATSGEPVPPKRFHDAFMLKTTEWFNKKNPSAFKSVEYFLEDPWNFPPPILAGVSGTGKTHLLWWLVHSVQAFWNKEAGRFVEQEKVNAEKSIMEGKAYAYPKMISPLLLVTNGSEIAHEIRSTVKSDKDDALDSVVAKFRQSSGPEHRRMLFVDDFEVMKMGDWLNEALYRIFDYRYQECLPTVIATNLSPSELKDHLGDRITRRVLENGKIINMWE